MPKVCVLAFDGLEIGLVERFGLSNLVQEEYGRTDISEFDKKATSLLWASFITGENLESEFTKKNPAPSRGVMRSAYKFLKSKVSSGLAISAKNKLDSLGILPEIEGEIAHKNVEKDLERKTIFDRIDDSVGINVPSFSKKRSLKGTVMNKIEGNISDSEYLKGIWDCFSTTREELLDNLNRDLVMAWFGAADWVGHVWRTDTGRMRSAYQKLDDLAGLIRRKFNGLVLIVSDHGMESLGKYGDHSELDYGFYSLSGERGLNRPALTSFRDMIEEEVDEGSRGA